ncbi:hypothetical protein MW887_009117 [Aspergillus wentii]|nr:hypothetical protein MW887_009117 [Aspergillus wentii]
MSASRSLARSLPALRAASPRTTVTRASSARTTAASALRSLSTSSKSSSKSVLASRKAISSSSPSFVATRNLHATAQQFAPATTTAATTATEYPITHDQITNPIDTTNFLDNEFVSSKATTWIDLHDPATNNLITRVPQSTDEELRAAVESAEKAFPAWRATSIMAKQQIIFKFVSLIREHWDRLASSITLEQGKTFADAKGDVLRGLQVAETACGITTQITGEVLEVAKDMETRSYREPLGVVASICPFSKSTSISPWGYPRSSGVLPNLSETNRLM